MSVPIVGGRPQQPAPIDPNVGDCLRVPCLTEHSPQHHVPEQIYPRPYAAWPLPLSQYCGFPLPPFSVRTASSGGPSVATSGRAPGQNSMSSDPSNYSSLGSGSSKTSPNTTANTTPISGCESFGDFERMQTAYREREAAGALMGMSNSPRLYPSQSDMMDRQLPLPGLNSLPSISRGSRSGEEPTSHYRMSRGQDPSEHAGPSYNHHYSSAYSAFRSDSHSSQTHLNLPLFHHGPSANRDATIDPSSTRSQYHRSADPSSQLPYSSAERSRNSFERLQPAFMMSSPADSDNVGPVRTARSQASHSQASNLRQGPSQRQPEVRDSNSNDNRRAPASRAPTSGASTSRASTSRVPASRPSTIRARRARRQRPSPRPQSHAEAPVASDDDDDNTVPEVSETEEQAGWSESHKAEMKRWFGSQCLTQGCRNHKKIPPRKFVSQFFGRNKKATLLMPNLVIPLMCRKCYQRSAYAARREANFWHSQLEEIRNTLYNSQQHEGERDWTIALSGYMKGMVERRNDKIAKRNAKNPSLTPWTNHNAGNETGKPIGKDKKDKTPFIYRPSLWVFYEQMQPLMGNHKTYEDCMAFLDHVRAYCQNHANDLAGWALPEFELLPIGKWGDKTGTYYHDLP